MTQGQAGQGRHRLVACAVVGAMVLAWSGWAAAEMPKMAGSKHDFLYRTDYPGLHALAGNEICRACHIPHGAVKDRLLQDFGDNWTAPAGHDLFLPQSVLCMGCHDGTIATPSGVDTHMATPMKVDPAVDPHYWNDKLPLSPYATEKPFVSDGLKLAVQQTGPTGWTAVSPVNPATQLPLYTGGGDNAPRMACTTCHDPHVENYNNLGVHFLRSDQAYGDLCVTCHANLYPR